MISLELRIGVSRGVKAPAVKQVTRLLPAPHLRRGIQRGPVLGQEFRLPAKRQ